jgi:curved DNA-binding protein CbpA
MSFQIERGLFKFDFIDHHAVLGIPVNADVSEVRKRYLKIARKLHPDSNKAESEAEKKVANQLLSKLVNPAYEQLSQSNSRDYLVSLSHLGRRLAAEKGKISLVSEAAKRLTQAGASLDSAYKSSVQSLASNQYEGLDQAVEKIAEISELNLVYLMLKGSKGENLAASAAKPTPGTGNAAAKPATGTGTVAGRPATGTGTVAGRPATGTVTGGVSGGSSGKPPDSQERSRAEEYIGRAEGYLKKNNFAGAVLELREALKLEQNSNRAHTLLGIAYLRQNQLTMAKVHINKALQLNPNDELAKKGKRHLEEQAQKSGGGKPKVSPQPDQRQQPDKPSDRKFWPFGGNKK